MKKPLLFKLLVLLKLDTSEFLQELQADDITLEHFLNDLQEIGLQKDICDSFDGKDEKSVELFFSSSMPFFSDLLANVYAIFSSYYAKKLSLKLGEKHVKEIIGDDLYLVSDIALCGSISDTWTRASANGVIAKYFINEKVPTLTSGVDMDLFCKKIWDSAISKGMMYKLTWPDLCLALESRGVSQNTPLSKIFCNEPHYGSNVEYEVDSTETSDLTLEFLTTVIESKVENIDNIEIGKIELLTNSDRELKLDISLENGYLVICLI